VVKLLSRLASVALPLLALTSAVWAGPGFPDVRAAASANGKFLVAMEFEYRNPDQQVRTIARITYRILRREEFINDEFTTTNPFWSTDWDVDMQAEGIPLPFISNDGEYLVLVATNSPFSDLTVLRIYRKRLSGGADLLRAYKLKDIWTADELKAHANLVSFGRPLWFAGSTLGFSVDGSAFVVKTPWDREAPWSREVRLDLNGGASHAQ